jgi:hypothetical protein
MADQPEPGTPGSEEYDAPPSEDDPVVPSDEGEGDA